MFDAGITVFENVGLIEARLFGVGWCTKVIGTSVFGIPVNSLVRTDCGGARDVIGFAEVKL